MKKVLSVFLASIIVFQAFASTITADAFEEKYELPKSNESTPSCCETSSSEKYNSVTSSPILYEEIGLRSENQKHFRHENGTYTISVYPEPVHFLNSSGSWEEVDNRLILKYDIDEPSYITKASCMNVSFPLQLKNEKMITVKKDGFKFGMAVLKNNPNGLSELSEKIVINNSIDDGSDLFKDTSYIESEIERENYQKMSVNNKISSATYYNAFSDADLQYIVSSSKIKENIIIDSKQDNYVYKFELSFDELIPVLQCNGSIYFMKNQNDCDPVFILETPFMFDADNNESHSVKMNLEGNILTIEADAKWINSTDRVFPVTIDPTISQNSNAIVDTYVGRNLKNENHATEKYTYGGNGFFNTRRAYIKMDMPAIPDNCILSYVNLRLVQHNCTFDPDGKYICAFDVGNRPWNVNTVTWNNQPLSTDKNGPQDNGTPIVDYVLASNSSNYIYNFNLTRIAKEWYRVSGANYGIMISTSNENKNGQPCFYSCESTTSAYRPLVTVTYSKLVGLESYWDYQTMDMGQNGTVYINTCNGQLTYVHPDAGTNGLIFPEQVSHIFIDDEQFLSGTYKNMKFGKGYKLNIIEIISQENGKFRLVDSDGTTHEFKYHNSVYSMENDPHTILTINDGIYTITFSDGSNKKYDSTGYLYQISDPNGNTIDITYSNGQITQISDGANQSISFQYDNSKYLTAIIDNANRRIEYTYNNGELTSIRYPDNTSLNLVYRNNILYSIESSGGIYWIGQGNNTLGSSSAVIPDTLHSPQRQISLSYGLYSTEITENGKSHKIVFDNNGRPVCLSTDDDTISVAEYSTVTDLENNIILSSDSFSHTENLLPGNYSKASNWTAVSENAGGAVNLSDTGRKNISSTSAKITRTATGTTYIKYQLNAAYDCSFVTDVNIVDSLSSGKVFVTLIAKDANGNELERETSVKIVSTNNKWQHLSVYFPAHYGNYTLEIQCGIYSGQGTVYFDRMQLSSGDIPTRINLLSNSGFSNSSQLWSGFDSDNCSIYTDSYYGDSSAKINGNIAENREIYQDINSINGSVGDILVIGAAATARSTASQASEKLFGVKVTLYNSNTPIQISYASFNDAVYDVEQHALFSIRSENYYNKIRIELLYNHECEYVCFDDVFIYKDAYATHYNYNSENLLDEIVQDNGSTVRFSYNGTDISRIDGYYNYETSDLLNPDYCYSYDYDSNHNLTFASDAEKTIINNYNSKGLPTDTAVFVNNAEVSGESYEYTADKNYLISETNSNGETVEYEYDNGGTITKGLVTKITDPNGNETVYTYDADNDTLLSISNSDGSVNCPHTDYEYDEAGRLIGISNDDIEYGFLYDDSGRLSSISNAESNSLVSITYSNITNRSNEISKIYNANNHFRGYNYDLENRLSYTTYNNSLEFGYYYYENNTVSKIIDYFNDETWKYQYNETGTLTNVSSSSNKDISYYYDANGKATGVNISDENGIISDECYSYNSDEQLINVQRKLGNYTANQSFSYDSLGRTENIINNFSSAGSVTDNYTFETNGSYQTGYIDTVSHIKTVNGSSSAIAPEQSYSYDANGNITHIYENNILKAHYYYDNLNRLIREDNAELDKTVVYEYDNCGDILSKSEYEYTSGDSLGSPVHTDNYSYGSSVWANGVTGYNGETIAYDAAGNPTTYRGYSMTWQKDCQLASTSKNGQTTSYTYDYNGLRRTKAVNDVATDYFYAGSSIVSQKTGNEIINFAYNPNGTPYGFTLNGTPYYYILNIQGDVTGIYDNSGTVVVNYIYDSWGRLESITGSLAATVGVRNPLRYRGYYYDTEIGLYYLQSRYYDPETGRFISSDSLLIAGDSINGTNMFAYCCNNPVNYVDPSGKNSDSNNLVKRILAPIVLGILCGYFNAWDWIVDFLSTPKKVVYIDYDFDSFYISDNAAYLVELAGMAITTLTVGSINFLLSNLVPGYSELISSKKGEYVMDVLLSYIISRGDIFSYVTPGTYEITILTMVTKDFKDNYQTYAFYALNYVGKGSSSFEFMYYTTDLNGSKNK